MLKTFSKTFILYIAVALAFYAAISFIYIRDFPKVIPLAENTQHQLSFQAPIRATIRPDTVDVLKINHTPVAEPVTINLHAPLLIEANGSGTATMMLSAFGLTVREVTLDVLPSLELIPCGTIVGVRIDTNGVMVLGTGSVMDADGNEHSPSQGKLKAGDLIISANGKDLSNKEDLMTAIAESGDSLHLQIMRDNETVETTVFPIKSEQGNMIGSWVRDSTQGIGTITYINPETKSFGALGHGIMDVDTKKLMSVRSGNITAARIKSVKKGRKGAPGELVGEIDSRNILGRVQSNSAVGIYGVMDKMPPCTIESTSMPIAKQDQIEEGPASLRSNVADNIVRDFEIYIENVNRFSSDDTKGMVIRITDPELLALTGGIVQGMSGSPIIQNGRLVGAVTHVFVQDPTKGYGIFIENMIRHDAVA